MPINPTDQTNYQAHFISNQPLTHSPHPRDVLGMRPLPALYLRLVKIKNAGPTSPNKPKFVRFSLRTTQPGKKVSQAVEGFNLYVNVAVHKAAQSTSSCRRYRWTTLAAMMAAYNANYAPPDILSHCSSGRITVSITWMIPLLAEMFAATIFAS